MQVICFWKYLEEDAGNFDEIKKTLIKNKKNISVCLFKHVYYSFIEKRAILLRNEFHFKFKDWKDKKNIH